MLIELKQAKATPEGVKISDTLGITDEQFETIKDELDNLTDEVSKAFKGEDTTMKDGGEVFKALNEMTPEALLFAAFVGVTVVAEQQNSQNPLGQLLASMSLDIDDDDNDKQPTEGCGDADCDVCKAEVEVQGEVK